MRRILGAAALGCGIFFGAYAAFEGDLLPASGAMRPATMGRLLLLDGARAGARIVAVGDRGYIVVSDDRGKTWRRAKAPEEPLLTAVDFLDERRGLAVGHDSAILASADGGDTWTQQFAAASEGRPLMDVAFLKPDLAIAIGAYGAYYESADGGRTWTARKVIADDRHLNALVRLGEGRLLILGEAGTILASDDWGRNWKPLESPYKGSFFGGLVADGGAVIAFGMRGRIYRSTDAGRSWKLVENASTASLIGGERLADGALVLAGISGKALVSRDAGESFVPIETGTTRAFAKPIAGDADRILLLGEAGALEVALPAMKR